jgi:hypothetical protein
MSTTIAYSHKGGYWKTRYSFFASFMRSVGRRFFSSNSLPVQGNTALVWEHHDDTPNRRNKFYGNSAAFSTISVSFNDNVSSNKIYKSFSLEGSDNIKTDGANTFTVNADNLLRKQFSMGRIQEKGGILYGHIGLSDFLLDGSNIEAIGTIEQTNYPVSAGGVDGLISPVGKFNLTRTASSVTNKCKYILMSGNGEFFNMAGALIDFNSGSSYNASEFLEPFNLNIFEDNPFLQFLPVEGADGYSEAFNDFQQYNGFASGTATLLEITPQEINGAPPRGQYAQATITLGADPFELHSLSVDYEPTNLDHSK